MDPKKGCTKSTKEKNDQWNENVKRAYTLVLMHSHPDLVQRHQMLSEWENINSKQDVLQLLTKVQDLSHKHDETK